MPMTPEQEETVSEEHRYVEGSDNIYADLGLPDPEMELNRDILARRIGAEIRARGPAALPLPAH